MSNIMAMFRYLIYWDSDLRVGAWPKNFREGMNSLTSLLWLRNINDSKKY